MPRTSNDFHSTESYDASPSDSGESYDPDYPAHSQAWILGSDTATDTEMARNLLAPSYGEYGPALRHSYDDRDPRNGFLLPGMVTGNDAGAQPVVHSADGNPPFSDLRDAVWDTMSRYPLTTPADQIPIQDAAAHALDARSRQHLSRKAYGDLGKVGENYDPSNPTTQYALDISVQASFDVSTSTVTYDEERKVLRDKENRTRALIKAEETRRLLTRAAGLGHTAHGTLPDNEFKRRRESSSPSSSGTVHGRTTPPARPRGPR